MAKLEPLGASDRPVRVSLPPGDVDDAWQVRRDVSISELIGPTPTKRRAPLPSGCTCHLLPRTEADYRSGTHPRCAVCLAQAGVRPRRR